jgi:type I restriction enzyme M protein
MINRRLREMTGEDISKIAKTFEDFDADKLKNVNGFCVDVTTKEIAKQDYILTP